jgi:hypothetical protein
MTRLTVRRARRLGDAAAGVLISFGGAAAPQDRPS